MICVIREGILAEPRRAAGAQPACASSGRCLRSTSEQVGLEGKDTCDAFQLPPSRSSAARTRDPARKAALVLCSINLIGTFSRKSAPSGMTLGTRTLFTEVHACPIGDGTAPHACSRLVTELGTNTGIFSSCPCQPRAPHLVKCLYTSGP